MGKKSEPIKLTELAFCAGCAAKLRAEVLMDLINPFGNLFSQEAYPNLIIGLKEADDAAVYKLDEERALVFTTDFFPPLVDDPYDYGAIAAANSISDIYAMGGKPMMALNIAAMPTDLPPEMIAEIFRGGAEKAKEADCAIAGGHTVRDNEPKYGLAVIGMANPNKLIRKTGLKPGDKMVYTKPLGFGLFVSSGRVGVASEDDMSSVIRWMKTLNKKAAELAVEFGVRCGTDVTGFSLMGHSSEMIRNGDVAIHYNFDQIPFLDNYERYMEMGLFPAGAEENYQFYKHNVTFDQTIDENHQIMLFDPQTSGGLLLGVDTNQIDGFMKKAKEIDQAAWIIGEVQEGKGIFIH